MNQVGLATAPHLALRYFRLFFAPARDTLLISLSLSHFFTFGEVPFGPVAVLYLPSTYRLNKKLDIPIGLVSFGTCNNVVVLGTSECWEKEKRWLTTTVQLIYRFYLLRVCNERAYTHLLTAARDLSLSLFLFRFRTAYFFRG